MASRAKVSPNRDMNELALAAHALGWVVEKTNGQHLRFTAPNGAVVFGPSTPSDRRAVRNTRAKLARAWPTTPSGGRT